ncbi:hypothetical protein ACFL2R_01645 [Patescibacteria group bacterium]
MFTRVHSEDQCGQESERYPGYEKVAGGRDEAHYREIKGDGKIFDILSAYRLEERDGKSVLVSHVVWSTEREEERYLYQFLMNNQLKGSGHMAVFVANRMRDLALFVSSLIIFFFVTRFCGGGNGESFLISSSLATAVTILVNFSFFGDFAAVIRCLAWMIDDMKKSGEKLDYYREFFSALSKTPYIGKARIARWANIVIR